MKLNIFVCRAQFLCTLYFISIYISSIDSFWNWYSIVFPVSSGLFMSRVMASRFPQLRISSRRNSKGLEDDLYSSHDQGWEWGAAIIGKIPGFALHVMPDILNLRDWEIWVLSTPAHINRQKERNRNARRGKTTRITITVI